MVAIATPLSMCDSTTEAVPELPSTKTSATCEKLPG
jgi:hypothetical protein